MKKIKKQIGRVLLYVGALLLALVIAVQLFVAYYPSFGGDVTKQRQELYADSAQFVAGTFQNQDSGSAKGFSLNKVLKIFRKFFFDQVENGVPENNIAIQKIDIADITAFNEGTRLYWFGHSAFLMQIDSTTILIDPMLSEVPAPHPWIGDKRFSDELPIEIENLPKIDAVIISHDHYDHLDYASILKLKDKVGAYFVPLGVGVHLEAWGVSSDKIHEKDWWEATTFKNMQLTCTPAQHFSGRKFNNRKSTLWSSWVIKSKDANIYFSGDSGYGKHFAQIGERHGPFDLALVECGQYNKMWPDIHMFPEESAQAGLDLNARAMMPIHWGAFKLSMHAWTAPIEQIRKEAAALCIPLVTAEIGAPIRIETLPKPNTLWW